MKAIIPVAGAGTRLRPLTYTQPKPLIPVAGKPIISFIIESLESIGVQDFVFVIGYLGEKIRYFLEEAYPNLNKVFVSQEERLGSAHAVWMAREHFIDAEEVFIFFGDVIIDADFKAMVDLPVSCLGIKKVPNPREYGVVEIGENGYATRVVEKPKIPKSDMAMVGIYKIREVESLVEALDFNITHELMTNGEFPLTDA
ncbi:MAG: nucleotidyltransferase family protein, partial [Saprospiraceae bacterium]|nr:nucleotidyltransferase family protein [Saprospiraceae bacterium]